MKTIDYKITSFDEECDDFHLEITDECVRSADITLNVEGDTMTLPSAVVACLVGQWGEPSEFIGKVVSFKLPQ